MLSLLFTEQCLLCAGSGQPGSSVLCAAHREALGCLALAPCLWPQSSWWCCLPPGWDWASLMNTCCASRHVGCWAWSCAVVLSVGRLWGTRDRNQTQWPSIPERRRYRLLAEMLSRRAGFQQAWIHVSPGSPREASCVSVSVLLCTGFPLGAGVG